ncbi:hypothetical protein AAVH_39418 [Aphelenchoides avenae]|nr:hypothetical protein AAVH_39418 [Aphelenchus avenae]
MSTVEVRVRAKIIENSSVTFERPYALRFTTGAPTANDLLKRIRENEPFSDPKFQPPKLTTEHEHFGTVDVLGTEPLVHLRSYSMVFQARQEVPAEEALPNVSSGEDPISAKNGKVGTEGVVARIKALLPHDPRRALELAKQAFFEAILKELKNHPELHLPAIEAYVEVILSLLGVDGEFHGAIFLKLAVLLPEFIDVSFVEVHSATDQGLLLDLPADFGGGTQGCCSHSSGLRHRTPLAQTQDHHGMGVQDYGHDAFHR